MNLIMIDQAKRQRERDELKQVIQTKILAVLIAIAVLSIVISAFSTHSEAAPIKALSADSLVDPRGEE